ncbi:mitochondrial carrier domain-containing protein, partial [Paraphysoderma sedebokerense]
LFRGISGPVLSVAGLNSILFVTYSNVLNRLKPYSSVPSSSSSASPLSHVCLAGLTSGFACFLVSTPSELIKCRAQVMKSPVSLKSLQSYNIVNSASRIAGLYRGGTITFLREGPGYAVYFGTYEYTKRLLASLLESNRLSSHDRLRPLKPKTEYASNDKKWERPIQLFAGGVAGVASWASIYPLDVIKSRVQTIPSQSVETRIYATKNPLAQIYYLSRDIYIQEGVKPFVKGMKPTLIRGFVVNAVTFVTYEWLMEKLKEL